MAASSEAQTLLQEYADLKRLIDSHKSRKFQTAASYRVPYKHRCPQSRRNSPHFPRNSTAYARTHTVSKARSLYALNRTAGTRPSYTNPRPQVPYPDSKCDLFPNQKRAFVIDHQLLTSQIPSSPGQSSKTVNKFQVCKQNSVLRQVPSSVSIPGTGTVKKDMSNLPTRSAQITIADELDATEKPRPAKTVPVQPSAGSSQVKLPQLPLTYTRTTQRPQMAQTLKTVPSMGTSQGKSPQAQTSSAQANIMRKPLAAVIPKSVPRLDRGFQADRSVVPKLPGKPDPKFSSRKSPAATRFQGSLKPHNLQYKFVRPNSLKLPGNSRTPSSVSTCSVSRTSTKYKLVATHKKNSPKTKSPVLPAAKSPARRQGAVSKYSWSRAGSQVPKRSPVGQNIVKSRYRLSKSSPGITPKLVRRVNKYSVKYVPRRHGISLRARECRPQFRSGRNFTQGQPKGKANLVVIGGMLYKSNKTKLLRTEDENARNPSVRSPGNQRIVNVRGERFSMDLNRKVLQRLSTTERQLMPAMQQTANGPSPVAKPRGLTRIDIGGETYIQTRPGVLVRSNTNQLRNLANRVVNRSIFRLRASKGKSQQYCLFYNKFGKCNNKEKGLCRYIHDPEKIAICKRFLRGECTVEKCLFSHTVCRSKMPVCTFFLHGRCNNDSCNYRHVNVNPNADICLDFAKGYCPLGEKCKNWHVSSCPQFEQTGTCDKANKCPLQHRRRVAKGPKRSAVTKLDAPASASDSRPSADEAPTDESSTRRRRCPSFISLESESDAENPSHKMQKVLDVPLQIKPDFLKLT